jgi:hypothetical protein
MRVTYSGDATNDGVLDYFPSSDPAPTANTIADWANVYSAQVELLVASAEEVRSEAVAVAQNDWPGTAADRLGAGLADDRRLHARFAFTVALRTRAPWYVSP